MGTGYTRQSAADIITGANITAAPLNSEFNAIQSAFDSSSGHSHDGTSGEGPLINLTTSITGLLPAANGGFAAIHKVDATVAPTSTDDSGSGYGPGSIWIDVTADKAYVCVDASSTAAVWHEISVSSLAGLSDLTLTSVGNGEVIWYNAGWENGTLAEASIQGILAEGAFIDGDKTKLDTIESSADVTDTTNVTAAGALMDSELADLTAIKTLSAPDNTTISTFGGTLVDDASASDARSTLGLGSLAVQSEIDSTDFSASTLVTEAEGLNSSDNDTSVPTTAAVKDYVDAVATDLVNDTTPQLGGNLDLNGNSIVFPGATVADVTGSDTAIVSGTAGTNGNVAMWNADGDLVDGSQVAANLLVSGDIGTTVQGYDVDTLKADVADTLTAGFRDTMDDDGTKSSGTYTPTDSAGTWSKKIVNGGAFTLAPPSPANNEVIYGSVLMINNASAGAVTVTGWTNTGGDTLDTTNTNKFIGNFVVFDVGGTEYSYLTWSALQ